MIEWVVTWTVMSSIPCAPPPPDPYGRDRTTMTLQSCYQGVPHVLVFRTEKEARKFVDDAPVDFQIQDFRIEKRQR